MDESAYECLKSVLTKEQAASIEGHRVLKLLALSEPKTSIDLHDDSAMDRENKSDFNVVQDNDNKSRK